MFWGGESSYVVTLELSGKVKTENIAFGVLLNIEDKILDGWENNYRGKGILRSNFVQFWISMADREDWVCKWDRKRINRDWGRKSRNCAAEEIKAREYSVRKWSPVVIRQKNKRFTWWELNNVFGFENSVLWLF